MKLANWKDFAELIGLAALVASLIFVGVQMRQDREIVVSEGNLANAANLLESNLAILEHADVWVRGNSGDELSDSEEVVFHYLVKTMYEVKFFETARIKRLGLNQIAENVVADFSIFLFNNPGARRVWIEQEQDTTTLRDQLAPWMAAPGR